MDVITLKKIGQQLITISSSYKTGGPKKEMALDPVLYALLSAHGAQVSRQYKAHLPNSRRIRRIDFRVGGTNPTLLEFACRPVHGASELYGPANTTELRKLCRFPSTKARLRALLLLDLCNSHLPRAALVASYSNIGAGPGNFNRSPVQVVYVHKDHAYSFKWSP